MTQSTTFHLQTADVTLSALRAGPAAGEPRGVLVALHGGGMRAGYFDGGATPSGSLLSLAAQGGWAALALDRPGYGASAAALPDGATLGEQARLILAALRGYAAEYPVGQGFFLVGHSLGAKVALACAARHAGEEGAGSVPVLGMDINGITHRLAVAPSAANLSQCRRSLLRNWGPRGLYPPGSFRAAQALAGPPPAREVAEAAGWPDAYRALAPRVRTPVRLTLAEYERWWVCDADAVEAFAGQLVAAPVVCVARQRAAGHNISLSGAAHHHHFQVLAFAEECRLASLSGGTAA
ncbi:alpha/beta fold hydrolase [Streptomyces sp. NPDC048664]|uniref:alpha/beta fold hydrolase n=1 Tax=Streptomyces sp. NPDC048664 TaxID=3154505 RepID=UPI003429CE69